MPFGGPDGGDGGKGGNVIVKADRNLNTLIEFKYQKHFKAENGRSGSGKNKTGKSGEDLIIKVPVGTIIKDINDNIIADLDEDGKEAIVARGGAGGKGNQNFATPTHQAPYFAEKGLDGEEKEIILELKLLADVGIIGFPNAGKSTLLSKISAATPKIADYPFTTLEPNVGVVKFDLTDSFVVADMPGLIEGASEGKGLGHVFLRHIERIKILWHLIEVTEVNKIIDKYNKINYELRKYKNSLIKKEQIIVITKMDIFNEDEKNKLNEVIDYFIRSDLKVFCISAITNFNLDELIKYTFSRLQEYKKQIEVVDYQKEYVIYELPKHKKDKVIKVSENVFKIVGDNITNYLKKLDFKYSESILHLHNYMVKNNLTAELEKKGIKEDDIVIINDFEFVYKPDKIIK